MIFNEEDRINYKNATHCHICEAKLGIGKIRDHCHLTGKSRGASHSMCNLDFNFGYIKKSIFFTN